MNSEENLTSVSTSEQPSEDKKLRSRREHRSLVFHLLYAMDAANYEVSLNGIVEMFNHEFETDIQIGDELFMQAETIIDKRQEIDDQMIPLLSNWRLDRIGVCTHLILRMAIWELKNTDTDSKIVINEAIELAKCFTEKDAYKFVNGVLDKVER